LQVDVRFNCHVPHYLEQWQATHDLMLWSRQYLHKLRAYPAAIGLPGKPSIALTPPPRTDLSSLIFSCTDHELRIRKTGLIKLATPLFRKRHGRQLRICAGSPGKITLEFDGKALYF